MSNPDELIAMLERILNGSRDESEVAQLRQWLKVSGTTLQCVSQDGKFNTNIGQVQGSKIHIGDRIYQFDVEALRELLQPTTHAPNIDWHSVSQAMLEEQLRLTTNPLTSGEGISYRTEQVYVPLGLVERKRQTRRREDVSPEQGSLLYEETEITQRFEHEQFLERVLQQGQSPKSRGKRLAIIGEPGAGKTTLLQQIARWVSEQGEGAIAIWVSLADLRGQELEAYLLERWLQAVARKLGQAEASSQVKDAFVAQFGQGRVWLLLDGVDEMQVSSGNPLSEISRQVRMGGLLSQARIVLSCRLNLWDSNRNALDTFDTYRTLEFSYPQQVEQFIGQWFGALSEGQGVQVERLCAALKAPGKERIRDLVKNPLRLTLLCFNWYLGEGTLPETKAGLYEQFVADFYEWKWEQFPTTGEQRKWLNAALGELAREAIDKEETRFRLRHDFVCEFLGEPDEEGSLFWLALQLGWLNKVGVDAENRRKAVYAFFHPTFQEYFAALAIDDWHYFLNHIPENPSHPDANYRVFESLWKEVILMWFGQRNVKPDQKGAFTEALVAFEDGCGDKNFYGYRAYLLAAVGTKEYRNCFLTDKIISQIIKWVIEDQEWSIYRTHSSRETKEKLLKEIEKRGRKGWVIVDPQQAAFQALMEMDYSRTRDKILQIINLNPNKKNYQKLIEVLGIRGERDPIAITTLAHTVQTTESSAIRQKIIEILGKISQDDTTAIRALIQIIQTPETEDICQQNEEYLRNRFTYYLEDAYAYLMHMGRIFEIEEIRQQAAAALVEIGEGNVTAINLLSELIQTTEDRLVCELAAKTLEQIDSDNPLVIYVLAQPSKYTEAESTRLYALKNYDEDYWEYCHSCGDYSDIEAQYDPFCVLLYEYEGWQQRSIDSLPVDIGELIQIIQSSDNYYDTWVAAKKLLQIDLGNKTAILTLEELSSVNDDDAIQWLATEDLLQINPGNVDLILRLTKLSATALDEIYPDLKLRLWEILEKCHSSAIVTALSKYISNQFNIRNSDCLEILWHYAQNMSYPDFYNAWNN